MSKEPEAKGATAKSAAPTARTCFVVSPIGADGSPERIRADWLFHLVISAVLKPRGYLVERADHITQPGLIDLQIIERLFTADLVVADLSTFNPNVFYEVGIRHCIAKKPTIHMYDGEARLPFDVAGFRTIPYQLTHPKDLEKARDDLEQQVKETEVPGFRTVTPVQTAIDLEAFRKSGETLKQEVTDMVVALSNRVASLEASEASRMNALRSWAVTRPRSGLGFIGEGLLAKPTALSMSDSSSLGILSIPTLFAGGGEPTDEKK